VKNGKLFKRKIRVRHKPTVFDYSEVWKPCSVPDAKKEFFLKINEMYFANQKKTLSLQRF